MTLTGLKTTILICVVFLCCTEAHAENSYAEEYEYEIPKNAIFLEAGGSALLGSINYERMISNSIGVRTGYGAGFPLLINYYLGDKYRFEMGGGVVCMSRFADLVKLGPYGSTLMTATLGHKYQPKESGVILRFTLNPFLSLTNGNGFFIIGLSAGYAF